IPLGIIAGLGSIIGVNLIIAINEKYLNIIVAILLVAIFLFIKNKNKLGIKEHTLTRKHYISLSLTTFILGIWGGFFGPGFGALSVILLVFFGFTFLESAAISRVIGVFMSGVAMIVFAQHGLINYLYGAILGAGFAIGSWIGIGIALKKGDTFVRGLLVIIIFITVLKLVLNAFNINVI
ncbi:MAG TPA: sulfite exporter TauE/SafE family protein, partial [Patescibacteria group bacterium]